MDVITYGFQVVEQKEKLRAISPASASDYRKSLRAWRVFLEGIPLKKLTPHCISSALTQMLDRGIATNTAIKRYGALNMVLKQAQAENLIEQNPMDAVPKPKRETPPQNPLVGYNLDRVKMMLESMTLKNWIVAVYLCLYAGLRVEETCGLQMRDIDLQARTLWIRHAIAIGDGGSYLAPPKNGRVRDVPLCDELVQVLTRWIEKKTREGSPMRPSDYLIGSGDRYVCPPSIGRKWSFLCDVEDYKGAAGKKPTMHDLRHTFATACVRSNMDIKTLQSILGHASAAITLDVYASADPSAKRAAASLISQAI